MRPRRRAPARRLPALALPLALLAACADPPDAGSSAAARRVADGDPELGKALARAAGCPACHVLPGVGPTAGRVGPALAGFGSQAYIAGRLPNRPDNLVRWLQNPPLVDPSTAMPDSGLTQAEARHVAAFLYTLTSRGGWGEGG